VTVKTSIDPRNAIFIDVTFALVFHDVEHFSGFHVAEVVILAATKM